MEFASTTVAEFLMWPMDWPLLGLLAALLSLESFSSGSTRTSAISIAFPLSFIVLGWLPHTFGISFIVDAISDPLSEAGLFLVIFVALYTAIHRMIFSFGSAGGSVVYALIHGAATAVIIAVFWIQTPGLQDLWQFGPTF